MPWLIFYDCTSEGHISGRNHTLLVAAMSLALLKPNSSVKVTASTYGQRDKMDVRAVLTKVISNERQPPKSKRMKEISKSFQGNGIGMICMMPRLNMKPSAGFSSCPVSSPSETKMMFMVMPVSSHALYSQSFTAAGVHRHCDGVSSLRCWRSDGAISL